MTNDQHNGQREGKESGAGHVKIPDFLAAQRFYNTYFCCAEYINMQNRHMCVQSLGHYQNIEAVLFCRGSFMSDGP